MTDQRKLTAQRIREDAAALAAMREHPQHQANSDEQRYASAHYPMNFSKGLAHNNSTGLVDNAQDFETFRSAIDNGFVDAFTRQVPVPQDAERRQWEAPTAGLVYDLQGPDAQAVTMPPAPELCSDELTFEMAEVYELALLRDEPFHCFDSGGGSAKLTASIGRLNTLKYATEGFKGRPRKTASNGQLDRQTVFRGSSPSVEAGPYLSQFMLIGNDPAENGYINYGAQQINQRVREADTKDDYMISWNHWYQVQQGYEVREKETCGATKPGQSFKDNRRFIYTPRDLATYVHIDQLYQAYLNACLILLSNGTPFDPAFDKLSGVEKMLYNPANGDRVNLNTTGFALWGGPHILSLLTEVATRGLKAVRYQKFNTHLRLRPEVLAARLEKSSEIEARYPSLCDCFSKMTEQLTDVLDKIGTYNENHPRGGVRTTLLPMAFEEGSPMHPAYGAGHATVAGACVTILKAFFDTSAIFARINGNAGFYGMERISKAVQDGCEVDAGSYQSMSKGKRLTFSVCGKFELDAAKTPIFTPNPNHKEQSCCPLTLEGELNKLAANISIGRNMAGVHYFSDYYDSARMGEKIAIGILEEQALCYPTDRFIMSIPTFDGEVLRIGHA